MPIVLDDGTLGTVFNLRVTPQHVVIGRDGRIQFIGHFTDERLENALVAARAATTGPAVAASAPKDVRAYKIGDSVAQLSAITVDGDTFKAHEPALKQPTVLVFLSASCESYLEKSRPEVAATCRQVREQVTQLAKKNEARWLGIAKGVWSTKDSVRNYRTKYAVTIPLTHDESGELFRAFRVLDFPTLIVIDAQGRVARRIEGVDAKSLGTLQSALTM
jgi:peroxiredoxin